MKYRGPCLYRGKNTHNNSWVKGSYISIFDDNGRDVDLKNHIIDRFGNKWDIHSDTLCAFTSMIDANRKTIFCGDILKFEGLYWEVIFDDGSFYMCSEKHRVIFKGILSSSIEVIGNIFDNPELTITERV